MLRAEKVRCFKTGREKEGGKGKGGKPDHPISSHRLRKASLTEFCLLEGEALCKGEGKEHSLSKP